MDAESAKYIGAGLATLGIAAWPQRLAMARAGQLRRLAVVGGGAAGVELVLAAAEAFRRAGCAVSGQAGARQTVRCQSVPPSPRAYACRVPSGVTASAWP